MTRRERTPERVKGGGDVAAAWLLVAALLLVLATISLIDPDVVRFWAGRLWGG